MTSKVVFNFMYRTASIPVSGREGCSLVAGLVATSIVVLSRESAAAALSSKRRWVRSPKVSEAAGGSFGGTDEVSVAWGVGDARGRHLFEFIFFWYSSRSLSLEVLRCIARWSLYILMMSTEHW